MATSPSDVTRLLKAWSGGDHSALDQLTPIVYDELHRLARSQMAGEKAGHVLQASALVNEAYLRLVRQAPSDWKNRQHFYAVSARLMRQILTDFARLELTEKRGNRAVHVDLSEIWELPGEARADFVDLDRALTRLAELDPRQAQIVELRFFGGLENTEVAAFLEISEPTVVRHMRMARLWLYNELTRKRGTDG